MNLLGIPITEFQGAHSGVGGLSTTFQLFLRTLQTSHAASPAAARQRGAHLAGPQHHEFAIAQVYGMHAVAVRLREGARARIAPRRLDVDEQDARAPLLEKLPRPPAREQIALGAVDVEPGHADRRGLLHELGELGLRRQQLVQRDQRLELLAEAAVVEEVGEVGPDGLAVVFPRALGGAAPVDALHLAVTKVVGGTEGRIDGARPRLLARAHGGGLEQRHARAQGRVQAEACVHRQHILRHGLDGVDAVHATGINI